MRTDRHETDSCLSQFCESARTSELGKKRTSFKKTYVELDRINSGVVMVMEMRSILNLFGQ
jgi:hypothetical protein